MLSRIKRVFKIISDLIIYLLLFLPAVVLYKNKHIWLISERGEDARDNGYWMFSYMRVKHPEINSYYVINPTSPDLGKVGIIGPTLKKGSLKHWLVFIAADVRMSTHLFLFAPAPYVGQFIKKHHTRHTVNVDLQHGITHNTFPSTYKEINGSDLYICGAKPEYEWVKENFHWDGSSIKYTGFARFDGLHDFKANKQILIMPTWRAYLRDIDAQSFIQSEYYKHWMGLLSNKAFIDSLEGHGYQAVFYIHYSLKKFAHLFSQLNKYIHLATFEDSDVQTLLKNSALLITDYSSVFFDFAYMKKPLIYYQFDYDSFYTRHYSKGFFDHTRDGFGPVLTSEERVVAQINEYLSKDCECEQKYFDRSRAFFPINDGHNCERIYLAIVQKQNEQKRRK